MLLGLGGIVVLVGGLLAWSMTAKITGAVIANGEVTVAEGNQTIEHLDGGAVAELYVRNGDRVSGGDRLLRLADASLRADLATLELNHADMVSQRNRLEAEQRGGETVEWDEALLLSAEDDPAVQALIDEDQALFDRGLVNHRLQVAILGEHISQAEADLGAVSAGDALEARNRIVEMQAQIAQLEANRSSEAEELLLAAQPEEHFLQERIRQLSARIQRATLHAPTSGTVFDLAVFGPGDVVFKGEPLLQIVPDDSELIVRARVSPAHIDQVHVGQEAVILFTAFPFRSSPERSGSVLGVSADAFADPDVGESWYVVELAIEPLSDTDGYGDVLALVPGMPAEVQISTGSRSVISYFVKPISDFFNRSLREE